MICEIENTGSDISKRKRYLRGTILSLLTQLLYRQRQENVRGSDFNLMFEEVLLNPDVQSLISPNTMKSFILLTRLGAYRVKGFNFLFKWLYT